MSVRLDEDVDGSETKQTDDAAQIVPQVEVYI